MIETIIEAPAEVTAYLEQIRSLADAKRDALGFLPASAYEEAATKGCLWVAVEGTAKKLRGYLFFGVRFPRLRVYQVLPGLCVSRIPIIRYSANADRETEELRRSSRLPDHHGEGSVGPACQRVLEKSRIQHHRPGDWREQREDNQSLCPRAECPVTLRLGPAGRGRHETGASRQACAGDTLVRDRSQRAFRRLARS